MYILDMYVCVYCDNKYGQFQIYTNQPITKYLAGGLLREAHLD